MGSWRPCPQGPLDWPAVRTRLLEVGLLTEPPPKQTIGRTPVRAQLVALNCFTSTTFLFLPPSRLEVPPGSRSRSCSQIPPPDPLRAESKLATRDCTINAIWLSSRPGRERSPLAGPRIRYCITWGGGQSVNCLPWGRKQALELPSPPPLLPLGLEEPAIPTPASASLGARGGPPSFQLSYLGPQFSATTPLGDRSSEKWREVRVPSVY